MSDVTKGLKLFEQNPGLSAQINLMFFEWQAAYPQVDVKKQIVWAHAWLLSNQRTKKKDILKFINNWLKGEEKRAGERRQADRRAPQRYVEQIPDEEEIMTADDFAKLRANIKKAPL